MDATSYIRLHRDCGFSFDALGFSHSTMSFHCPVKILMKLMEKPRDTRASKQELFWSYGEAKGIFSGCLTKCYIREPVT